MVKHIDLFSGIGGFALAVDRVWHGAEHIFCDNDKFCQAIINKHWPGAKIYDDIRTLTNPSSERSDKRESENNRSAKNGKTNRSSEKAQEGTFLLTGGFPCQPFSQAGQRKGKSDDRFLWPEMLRVIREFKPTWVIGENVAGITTMVQYESTPPMDKEGNAIGKVGDTHNRTGRFVAQEIVESLETEGYDVQVFIIPDVAVNAPHRRDRVWFIAHRSSIGNGGSSSEKRRVQKRIVEPSEQEGGEIRSEGKGCACVTINSHSHRRFKKRNTECKEKEVISDGSERTEWNRNWIEIASELCRVDDGVPGRLGEVTISAAKHREQQIKAYGNAIVPQVAEMIMRAIKETNDTP